MTTTELYAIYCQAYADFDPSLGSAAHTLVAGRTAIERAIAEFAAADAENGTPRRSREAFERAVGVGQAALGPLGLRAA
jgi:hypothetical protein